MSISSLGPLSRSSNRRFHYLKTYIEEDKKFRRRVAVVERRLGEMREGMESRGVTAAPQN